MVESVSDFLNVNTQKKTLKLFIKEGKNGTKQILLDQTLHVQNKNENVTPPQKVMEVTFERSEQ